MPHTITDASRLLDQERFVGRDAELSAFESNLQLLRGGVEAKHLFAVNGQGGVGKSTLLRRFEEAAWDAGFRTATTNEADPDVLAVLARLAQQLEAQDRKLKKFGKVLETYWNRRLELLGGDDSKPEGLESFLTGAVARGALAAAGQLTGMSILFSVVDDDMLARKCEAYIARKVKKSDERRLLRDPVGELTRAFVRDLRETLKGSGVALLFDTFERTSAYLDPWLRELIGGRFGKVDAPAVFVVAGRRELDRNAWSPYEPIIARFSLERFTEAEARHYLELTEVTNESVAAAILESSGRLPMSVAYLASQSPEDPSDVADASETAVERLLHWIAEPALRRLAQDAALPRRLDEDVLSAVMEADAAERWRWLKEQPFLLTRGDGWIYHDAFRPQVIRVRRRDSPIGWASVHERVARHFDRLAADGHAAEPRWADARWRALTVEASYHRLCRDPGQALSPTADRFVEALTASRMAARLFAEAVRQAGVDAASERLRRFGETLLEGLLALPVNGEPAEAMWSMLLDYELEPVRRAKALDWRGFIRMRNGDNARAVADISEALVIVPGSVEYRTDRALALMATNDAEGALVDLDLAHAVDPSDDGVLLLRAAANTLLMRLELALKDVEAVLALDRCSAEALTMRGEVLLMSNRIDEALEVLDDAVSIAPENPEARAARAQARLAHRDYDDALADVDGALERSPTDFALRSLRLGILTAAGRMDEAVVAAADIADDGDAILDFLGKAFGGLPAQVIRDRIARGSRLTGLASDADQIIGLLENDRDSALRQLRAEAEAAKARALWSRGDLAGACTAYDDALGLRPENFALLAERAGLKLQLAQPEAALSDYEQALARGPEALPALLGKVEALVNLDRGDDALATITEGLSRHPRAYGLWLKRLSLLQRRGDAAGVAAISEVIYEDAPKLVEQTAREQRSVPTGIIERAVEDSTARMGGNAAAAIEVRKLAVTDPDAAVDHVRSEMMRVKGLARLQQERFDDAFAAFDAAVSLTPDDAASIALRGEAHQGGGRLREALSDFEDALRLDPELEWVRDARARLLARMDDEIEEGGGRLDRALEQEPDDPALRVARGFRYVEMDQPSLALVEFNRALERQPAKMEALLARAATHVMLESFDAAVSDSRAILELGFESDVAQYVLSEALQGLGRHSEALAAAERAVSLEPDAWSHYRRGCARSALGDSGGARDDMAKASALRSAEPDEPSRDLDVGLFRFAGGDIAGAEALYREALAREDTTEAQVREATRDLHQHVRLSGGEGGRGLLELLRDG